MTLSLDAEVAQRLAAYASWHRCDQSDVAAAALVDEMRGFTVVQRNKEAGPVEEPADVSIRIGRAG